MIPLPVYLSAGGTAVELPVPGCDFGRKEGQYFLFCSRLNPDSAERASCVRLEAPGKVEVRKDFPKLLFRIQILDEVSGYYGFPL